MYKRIEFTRPCLDFVRQGLDLFIFDFQQGIGQVFNAKI